MSGNNVSVSGFISNDDFVKGCQALKQINSSSKQTLLTMDVREEEEAHYLVISRQLSADHKAGGPTTPTNKGLNKPGTNCISEYADVEDFDDVDGDTAAIHHGVSHLSAIVKYDIVYSYSYRVPVLYFSLLNLESATPGNIDIVYDLLVPEHVKAAARSVGVMGGIGMTNHPLTDIPCFWIHPCNTAKAMSDVLGTFDGELAPLKYMILWAGLVGLAVGLSLPMEMGTPVG